MRYLTFALAKGRLANKTMDMFEKLGITCDSIRDKETRKLIFVNEDLKLKFFLAKASDVPTYVEYGAADIGIVGEDTILEEGRNLYEVMDLGFGKCKMCVCGPESAREKLQHHELIRVASKYPNIAKDYFNNIKHQTVEIIKLNGSVELAPIVGLAEVIVDIVETGATLRENGLEVLEESFVAGKPPRFHERGLDRQVGRGFLQTLVNGADTVTDLEPDVPEQADQLLKLRLEAGVGRFIEQEQQVDVGFRPQLSAAVAADRHEGERSGEVEISPQVAKERIHQMPATQEQS